MENKGITDPDLKEVSGYLLEQAEICHSLAKSVLDVFRTEKRRDQNETLKMFTRLISASATAAGALNRLKGTQINQTIMVHRMEKAGEGASPQTAKTNGGWPE